MKTLKLAERLAENNSRPNFQLPKAVATCQATTTQQQVTVTADPITKVTTEMSSKMQDSKKLKFLLKTIITMVETRSIL